MSLYILFFYFLATLALLSAIGILISRNVFYSAILLLVCLLALSGIYIYAYAEFVAVTQILVYAGGILVVIIFGIMLTSKVGDKPLIVKNRKWFGGVLAGIVLLSVIISSLLKEQFILPDENIITSHDNVVIQMVGIRLLTDFVLPFEIAGLLLLTALIGAAATASGAKKESQT